MSTALVLITLLLGFLLLVLMKMIFSGPKNVNPPPAVPGLPLVGNLLQLTEKKPHMTFTKWAEEFGPIYTIQTGATSVVVLNSTELAKELVTNFFKTDLRDLTTLEILKEDGNIDTLFPLDFVSHEEEAMVTKYSSISTRNLSNALKILTSDKSMVAMSDYGEMHKMVKKYILTSILGANAQKRHRANRDTMIENITNNLYNEVKSNPGGAVNLRNFFRDELFRLAVKQALGKEVKSIYVEDLGTTLSESEIFDILVVDPMMGAIEVDWRDFFPYLKWVPNRSMELKIQRMDFRRNAVMKALIKEHKNRINSGEVKDCFLDFLLAEAKTLTEKQMMMLLWESIIETSDTTLVTSEWAMFELAKNPKCQDRLYQEIQEVCGSEKIKEEHLSKLPYLNAVFHETLRRHSPVPVVPLRHAHEDTELGGFHIPAGSEIAINIYGCNMSNKEWEDPAEWKPERFLTGKHEAMDLYKTMAFGGGKRVCAGSLQAMLIACTAIGRFIQEFEWKLQDGQEEDVQTVILTTQKLHPMLATITPRQ